MSLQLQLVNGSSWPMMARKWNSLEEMESWLANHRTMVKKIQSWFRKQKFSSLGSA
jgi:hypothetical protein